MIFFVIIKHLKKSDVKPLSFKARGGDLFMTHPCPNDPRARNVSGI